MEEMMRYTPAEQLYKIGLDYLNGTTHINEKRIKDKIVAMEFFRAAADKGSPDALRVLKKLALNDKPGNRQIRFMAIEKLSNQEVLAKIALNDTDVGIRGAAVDSLTDQNALFKVASKQHGLFPEEYEAKVRSDAVRKISKKDLLKRIINGGEKFVCNWWRPGHSYMEFELPDVYGTVDLREIAREQLAEIEANEVN